MNRVGKIVFFVMFLGAAASGNASERKHYVFGCYLTGGAHRWVAVKNEEVRIGRMALRIEESVTLNDSQRKALARLGVFVCEGFNLHSRFCLNVRTASGASLNQSFQQCRGHEGKFAFTR